MELLSNILIFIAGLGVFIFSIKMLSSSIEKMCGNKMRKQINKFSSNRFKALGFGFGLTTILQSSTASVVMIVGFTSAGIILLPQAIGLIIGANIASVIPSFLISVQTFNVTNFFCALAGVGAFILIFAKTPWLKNLANTIIGFGLLFVGILLMKDATAFLQTEPAFISFFSSVTNPALLILIGTLFTILIQSSLGTFAVVISLLGTSTVVGIIPMESAVCLIYGANLGTAISTTVVASLSSSGNGRRAALFHSVYSLIGCLIFGLLCLTPWVEVCFGWCTEPAFKLALVNLCFNFVVGILCLPFVKSITFIFSKIKFGKKKKNPLYVTEFVDSTQAVSIAKATKKMMIFYDELRQILKQTMNFIFEENNTKHKKLYKRLLDFQDYITRYNSCVSAISSRDTSVVVNKDIENLLSLIKQIDRINRNCIKISAIMRGIDKKVCFSAKLNKFLTKIIDNSNQMLDLSKQYFEDPDCKFLIDESESSYDKIISLSHTNSETKLAAKDFVIENSAKSKAGTEKNTTYIEIVSYLNMISNNIADVVFGLASHLKNVHPKKYEQLVLDGLEIDE